MQGPEHLASWLLNANFGIVALPWNTIIAFVSRESWSEIGLMLSKLVTRSYDPSMLNRITYKSISLGSLTVSFSDDHRFHNVIKLFKVLFQCFVSWVIRNSSNEEFSEFCLIFFHCQFHNLQKKNNNSFVSKLGIQDIIWIYQNSSVVEEFQCGTKLNKWIIRLTKLK